jgi:acetyltransferase
MHLADYHRNQVELMETPPSIPEGFKPDVEAARALTGRAVAEGREWLTEPEAKDMLAAYGIPVVPTRIATTPVEAAAIAAEFGRPVALKILSEEITHKSDVGGVALDLTTPEAVEAAAGTMLARVRDARPDAAIQGFTVQPMVERAGAHELIAGIVDDVQFGPVILFGQGGTAVEVINDKALALPPLNLRLAHDLVARTRVSRLLPGVRGAAGVDMDDVAFTLVKLSQLVIDIAEVTELDINPLLAGERGVVALDARVRVARPRAAGTARLAIRPYPNELQREVDMPDGRRLLLRPVRPEDEPSFHRTFAQFTPQEIRMRFFVPMKTLTHVAAARFTQIDYDREMAFVLTDFGRAGTTEVYGVVRMAADPDNEKAEFAIIVRGDTAGIGMGRLMMTAIVDYARERGIGEIWGDVLVENQRMLQLSDSLGFRRDYAAAGDRSVVRVRLEL